MRCWRALQWKASLIRTVHTAIESPQAEGENMASVLITGTSKGIGLETAVVVARAGHKVFATMRSPDRYPELAQTAAKERLPIQIFKMDVDSDESVNSTVAGI